MTGGAATSGASRVGSAALATAGRAQVSPVVLVTTVGAAEGAKAAAAALACSTSEPDRAALLIDIADARPPGPSLIATAGARTMEERLAAHMPDAAVASRGRICQLTLPADPDGVDRIPSALPLARESAAVVHLPPALLCPLVESPQIQATGALLRADLTRDRALTALAVRDLMDAGLRIAVLKRPPSRLAARAALLGALPTGSPVLSRSICDRLSTTEDKRFQQCYDRTNGAEGEQGETQHDEGRELGAARSPQDRAHTEEVRGGQ